jgi:hypothetical protein
MVSAAYPMLCVLIDENAGLGASFLRGWLKGTMVGRRCLLCAFAVGGRGNCLMTFCLVWITYPRLLQLIRPVVEEAFTHDFSAAAMKSIAAWLSAR